VEQHGVVDGIYRLSGVSSNIQRLRQEFDSDRCPDLHRDVYLQDIHCVSSLCKAYFRELPNPLLTYQLYDKFADAVATQTEEARLVKIKEVLKDLPPPHYR
ncbi:RHG30 protein, partial [Alectura lathami]|nr:RHG30 protein [Alectura lathami]